MNLKQKAELISKAIEARFKDEVQALEARRQAFAAEALQADTGPAPSLDRSWISFANQVELAVKSTGFEHVSRYHPHLVYEPLLDHCIKLSQALPVTIHHRMGRQVKVTDKALAKVCDKLVNDIRAHIKEREAVRTALQALLATVRTYNQLTKVWPEGEALYEFLKPVPKTRELVDPNVLRLLNKELIK